MGNLPTQPQTPQAQPAQKVPQPQPQPQSPVPQQPAIVKKKSKNNLTTALIILIVIVILIAGVILGGIFLFEKFKKDYLAREAAYDKQSDEMFDLAMKAKEKAEKGTSGTTNSDQGSSSVSLSKSFPGDISRYSGSTVIKSAEKSNEIIAGFSTSDSAEKVYNFYKGDLVAKGWQITSSSFQEGMGIIYASKADKMLIMTIFPENGKTTIAMDINLPIK